jgi:hypothetical protein
MKSSFALLSSFRYSHASTVPDKDTLQPVTRSYGVVGAIELWWDVGELYTYARTARFDGRAATRAKGRCVGGGLHARGGNPGAHGYSRFALLLCTSGGWRSSSKLVTTIPRTSQIHYLAISSCRALVQPSNLH